MSENPSELPKARRWPWRLAMALMAILFVVGPWPVDDSGFEGSTYQTRTLDRLDRSSPATPAGPIRVGLAEVDLTPATPRPLAGFIGQVRTPYVGVDSPCLARALTVESGSGVLTILTADLLLINAKLARAICDRAGIGLDQVYFTSSHNHGGPGGWGDHPLEMLAASAYDPAFFDELASKLADVVRRSRVHLEPAEFGFVQVQAKSRQSNRVDRGGSTHDALSALIFRPAGAPDGTKPICVLTVFGAHATVSHPVPPRLGADYPSSLTSELKRRLGARSVLFAAGAVGDASPSRPKAVSQAKSAEILGANLADDLMTALPSARFVRDLTVANLRLDVDLPPVRLPFLARWLRFSPLATWWIVDRRTHLHAVRLGPAVLVGFPGDYSGHLADHLVEATRADGMALVTTSFDGDYRGYFVSEPVFREFPCYETRLMSFYGPWSGDYLNDVARRMVDRLADFPGKSTRPASGIPDLVPRVALAILLVLGSLVGWKKFSASPLPRGEGLGVRGIASPVSLKTGFDEDRPTRHDHHPNPLPEGEGARKGQDVGIRWRGLVKLARRAGWGTVAIASASLLAFEVAPDWVDWARFGLPDWARMVGIPLGLYALAISRGKSARAALLFVGACGLISANWVVVLMIARGWVKSGLNDRPRAASLAMMASETETSGPRPRVGAGGTGWRKNWVSRGRWS